MSLAILRRLFLQNSRTLYKIKPRNYSADSKTTKISRIKPKKPPGIFDLYFQDHVQEEHANENNTYLNQNELIHLIGEKWKSAPEDQKRAYREKFLKSVEEYKQYLIDFEDGLDDRQQIIEALKNVRKKESETSDQPPSFKETDDLPNRQNTAFGHFIKAALEAFPKSANQSIDEWNEQMAEKWRDMSEQEKQSFREASNSSSKKFEVEKDDPKSTFNVDEVKGFQR